MSIEVNKVKIFVTVPTENTQEVRNIVCNAGAGIIGKCSYCTPCVKSLGIFISNENAKPYIGKNNRLEFIEKESKIYRTDKDGSIKFKIKNNRLKIETSSP